MSSTLVLTPEEQTRLTIALELEHCGFDSAADYLRSTIISLRFLQWKDEPKTIHVDWAEVFRKHRGSLQPFVDNVENTVTQTSDRLADLLKQATDSKKPESTKTDCQ